jgi:hypothetical protein
LQEAQLDGTTREYGPAILAEPPLGSVIGAQGGVLVPIPAGGLPSEDVTFPSANLSQSAIPGSASAIALHSINENTLVYRDAAEIVATTQAGQRPAAAAPAVAPAVATPLPAATVLAAPVAVAAEPQRAAPRPAPTARVVSAGVAIAEALPKLDEIETSPRSPVLLYALAAAVVLLGLMFVAALGFAAFLQRRRRAI